MIKISTLTSLLLTLGVAACGAAAAEEVSFPPLGPPNTPGAMVPAAVPGTLSLPPNAAGRVPAMINFSSGTASILAACAAAEVKHTGAVIEADHKLLREPRAWVVLDRGGPGQETRRELVVSGLNGPLSRIHQPERLSLPCFLA